MTNIQLYDKVCQLKNRLENHPDSPKAAILKALILIEQVNAILDIKERRRG